MKEMKKIAITLNVNNETYDVVAYPNRTLLDVIRDDLHLTGTKESCGEGVCGSCTVLVNSTPVRSCLTLAVAVQGKEITTIEGLSEGEKLHPVQEAFVNHHAIQCGFCSPGMILTAYALLKENPRPTEVEIRRAISGNVCRCTGYAKIVEAVKSLAEEGR
jgi:carbon-monoxide dehydrogenase small subunit